MLGRRIAKSTLAILILFISIFVIVGSSVAHAQSRQMAITVPILKMPFDANYRTATFNSGPHGSGNRNSVCTILPTNILSGLDIGLAEGTPVLAMADGSVVRADGTDPIIGNIVGIAHGTSGLETQYWHLESIDPSIHVGATVKQGQVIGKSGNQFGVVHLHIEFTQYPSGTPYAANGISLDGYQAWTLLDQATGKGYNYQGTLTRGNTHTVSTTYGQVAGAASCGNTPVTEVLGQETFVADAGSSPHYMVSTNHAILLVNFSMKMQDIGTNTSISENNNPVHFRRTATIKLLDSNSNKVGTYSTIVTYSNQTGLFTGSVNLGTLNYGVYLLSVRTYNTLYKAEPGFFSFPSGTLTEPTVNLISGDINQDDSLDILDYNILVGCFGSKANSPSCIDKVGSDLNDNNQVDGGDYNLLLRNLMNQGGN